MSYRSPYIDIPKLNNRKAVGRVKKMTKSTITAEPKTAKKYNKTRGEHFKDIVIAMLVTAIIAFGLGVAFESNRNTQTQQAVKAALLQTTSPVKK